MKVCPSIIPNNKVISNEFILLSVIRYITMLSNVQNIGMLLDNLGFEPTSFGVGKLVAFEFKKSKYFRRNQKITFGNYVNNILVDISQLLKQGLRNHVFPQCSNTNEILRKCCVITSQLSVLGLMDPVLLVSAKTLLELAVTHCGAFCSTLDLERLEHSLSLLSTSPANCTVKYRPGAAFLIGADRKKIDRFILVEFSKVFHSADTPMIVWKRLPAAYLGLTSVISEQLYDEIKASLEFLGQQTDFTVSHEWFRLSSYAPHVADLKKKTLKEAIKDPSMNLDARLVCAYLKSLLRNIPQGIISSDLSFIISTYLISPDCTSINEDRASTLLVRRILTISPQRREILMGIGKLTDRIMRESSIKILPNDLAKVIPVVQESAMFDSRETPLTAQEAEQIRQEETDRLRRWNHAFGHILFNSRIFLQSMGSKSK